MVGRHSVSDISEFEFTLDGYRFAINQCVDPIGLGWELWAFGSMWGCFDTIDDAVEYSPIVVAHLEPTR